jgi:hypothetical protein
MASKKAFDTATGKATFERVKDSLLALPADTLVQPNIDLQSAAMAALVLVDRAKQADRLARFALLPAALFSKSALEDLETVANATLHVELESLREGAANTGVKVDVAIVQEATDLRERMLRTAEYNLGHLEPVARELADIRLGTGYLDLANDCSRLAAVYAAYKTDLAVDKRYYDAADAAHATAVAQKIRAEYRAAASRSGQYAELRPRAYTELCRLYNEVRAAAQFLFRSEPSVVDEFAPLRVAAGALGSGRRAKKTADGDAPAAAPNGGGGMGTAVTVGGSE